MYDYIQKLREATLDAVEDKTPQEKADALNIIECIIGGDMAVGDLVKAIADGTVPLPTRHCRLTTVRPHSGGVTPPDDQTRKPEDTRHE